MSEELRPYDPKRFGAAIKRRRKALDLTQEQLAGLLGITHGYVSQLERGRLVEITWSFLQRYAEQLKMPVEQLMEEGGVPS